MHALTCLIRINIASATNTYSTITQCKKVIINTSKSKPIEMSFTLRNRILLAFQSHL